MYDYNSTDCVPQCKFGDCNTTIGKCICPPGHSGADCSVISTLLFFLCVRIHLCMCMCIWFYVFVLYIFKYVHVLEYHCLSVSTCTDCVPQCKFGDCNTTIGDCICPPGHSGADCSVRGMLCVCTCVCMCV